MTITRITAALAAPAVAAALLTLGVATAAAQPTRVGTCTAAQSASVSAPNTPHALTRAGQLSGAQSQARAQAPSSCIGH